MKKGLRNYAIRSDTNAERRHISDMASRIFCAALADRTNEEIPTDNIMRWSVEQAFYLAEMVDIRVTQELEEIKADLERERAEIERRIKEKGARDAEQKQTAENADDIHESKR